MADKLTEAMKELNKEIAGLEAKMFRRKKKEPETTIQPGQKRLRKYWDDSFAEYRYHLLSTEIFPSFYGSLPYWEEVASGDRDWAEKIADHYGLEIEGDDEA